MLVGDARVKELEADPHCQLGAYVTDEKRLFVVTGSRVGLINNVWKKLFVRAIDCRTEAEAEILGDDFVKMRIVYAAPPPLAVTDTVPS